MGKLYLVPTPIGNLEDMTLRAIKVLKEVDVVLAEDTRTSGKLLKHFEIDTPLQSHHMHNEHKQLDGLVQKMKEGVIFALISDAGTPAELIAYFTTKAPKGEFVIVVGGKKS